MNGHCYYKPCVLYIYPHMVCNFWLVICKKIF